MSNPTSDEQDRSDMRQLAAGQDDALDALISRHSRRLFHYLLRILQNETEAAELASEAFVRVYHNHSSFDAAQNFSTWLYTIATNLARDLQRRHARSRSISLDANTVAEGSGLAEALASPLSDPSSHLERSEELDAVRAAIAALPDDLRVPLVLAAYEEKTHAQIAAILACSPKAVEMRIYRARQQLRLHLLGRLGVSSTSD